MTLYVILVFTFLIQTAVCELEFPELELQNKIFKGYNTNVRPVNNYSKPVIVTVGLTLRKVLHLNEIRQSFKSTINVNLYWYDDSLQWNKSEFNGINNIEISYNRNVWIPDLMIYNAVEKPEDLGINDAFIRLNNNGQIYVWTQTNFETACEIKTKKYPYDMQVCDIVITKFMSSDLEIDIRPLEKYVNMNEYVEIAEWKIEDTSVKTTVDPINISVFVDTDISSVDVINYTSITYTLTLQRSCKLCFFNNILPVMVLAALNFLTFFVHCESGEKLSYPIAMFLTLAVFLTIITRSLPESIDGVSYLSSYVTFQLAVSAMILLCAIISLQIHHKKRKSKAQNRACRLTRCFRHQQMEIKECKNYNATPTENHTDTKQSETASQCNENLKSEDLSYAFDKLMFSVLGLCELIATTTFIVLILK
ncbi:acetylcholine receptor subunit alpha-like [Ruditapes philippinarum]|uniref:acetylcholine receptor subunit alpha-like n=1 Tax=Ruditapes philippinarum TaxID=129788 RepID=UPI00295BBDFB|nr:acetylcholine receptor subunit alpha-like [Ruditapes philippinarum]